MVSKLVIRGLIAGIVAGLLAFGFAKMVAEPIIGVAIHFESAQDDAERAAKIAHGEQVPPEEPDMFSRDIQSGPGLFTGVVVVGAGIGAIFGILYAFAYGRSGGLGAGATATLVSVYALWSVYVIPALKYPPNPPAVGQPDTIKLRTGLYFLMIAISIASLIGGLFLKRVFTRTNGAWLGSMMALAVYAVVILFFYEVLPTINEVPANFPAVTLWHFRIDSLTTQIILWMGTGLFFGYFAEKSPNG